MKEVGFLLIKIIDDDPIMVDNIYTIIEKNFGRVFYDYSIEKITDDFESAVYKNGDIFFLDIDLKGYNGIRIAEKIREYNYNAIIIFVSAMNDMVFDSLIVQPFYFVRKNNFDNDMNVAFDLIKKYVMNNYKIITFDLKGRKTAIKLTEIVYLESFLHEIIIHTLNDTYRYSGSFQNMFDLINSSNIIRIHKSYAINMFWMKEIHKDEIVMNNGVILNIGKKYKNSVLLVYKEYLLR